MKKLFILAIALGMIPFIASAQLFPITVIPQSSAAIAGQSTAYISAWQATYPYEATTSGTDYVFSTGNGTYRETVASCTSASTPPSGAGPFTDGTCSWTRINTGSVFVVPANYVSTVASGVSAVGAGGGGTNGDTMSAMLTTAFPNTENPISNSGLGATTWVSGGAAGTVCSAPPGGGPGGSSQCWANVETTPGLAFSAGMTQQYGDATAVVSPTAFGTYGSNQAAQGTMNIITGDGPDFTEAEIRLNTTITSGTISGYEFDCAVSTGDQYYEIVRWNGPLANSANSNVGFSILTNKLSPAPTPTNCANGDTLAGTNVNGLLSFYHNGVLVAQTTDNPTNGGGSSPWTGGSPGFGLDGIGVTSGAYNAYGLGAFTTYSPGYLTGGGGGAFASATALSTTAGATLTYQAGVGGSAGASGTKGTANTGGSGTDTWFNGASCAAATVCAKAGTGGTFVKGGGLGGSASASVGNTKFNGGNSGTQPDCGGPGGGGAASKNGAGAVGGGGDTIQGGSPDGSFSGCGNVGGFDAASAGGGGGANGGSAGQVAAVDVVNVIEYSGNGGNGFAGTGGGLGGQGTNSFVVPGIGTMGGGGGGGASFIASGSTAYSGGNSTCGTEFDSFHGGAGGGGGGFAFVGGAPSNGGSAQCGGGGGSAGLNGAGDGNNDAAGGRGGNGFIVFTYNHN